MIASIALLLADVSVALRGDARPVTQAQAEAMTPAALADALLRPGHPAIIEVESNKPWAPPPPSYVPPLDVTLIGEAKLDTASGFCVKHRWHVTGSSNGQPEAIVRVPTLYRLPPASGECEAQRFVFFSVASEDTPFAFNIVRLLADAATHPQRFDGVMWYAEDDSRFLTDRRVGVGKARSLLTKLPLDRVFVVRREIDTPLLPATALIGADGHPRETWEIYASDIQGSRVWTIHLALDRKRLAAIYLYHAFPAPF